jgi:K+:H+ antiporter subunit KhtT
MSDSPIERGLGLDPNVREQHLPGIGHRYDVPSEGDEEVMVVIHHTGRRSLYLRRRGADEPEATATLNDRQARTLGAILSGAYFKPAVVEEVEAVIGGLLIEWVTLHPDSPAVGRSIAELEIRRRTKMTVAAILRNGVPLVAPEPFEVLQANDRLVVIGRREDLGGFVRQVVG